MKFLKNWKGEPMDKTEYKNQKSSVTLTNEQWNKLAVYILMSTSYRKGELETWQKLAGEQNANGEPAFPNAKGNVEFFSSLEDTLDEIKKAIDNR